MYSVTQRISQIKQPRGGYVKRKDFTCITLEDGIELNSQENIHPSLIGFVNGSVVLSAKDVASYLAL